MQRKITRAAAALKSYGAIEVYIFGSLAEGTFTRDSDVDMAVSGLPPGVFFRALGHAHEILGRPVDLIDLDDGSLFSEYLKKEGLLLHVDHIEKRN
ncbi:MAG: nucleotidyltransferase domain-containing protein [Candidatus Latescibacter sp.]|nr:nucleotidyltransferase domain-containing protein [Candidatus Latescibacter sp.]